MRAVPEKACETLDEIKYYERSLYGPLTKIHHVLTLFCKPDHVLVASSPHMDRVGFAPMLSYVLSMLKKGRHRQDGSFHQCRGRSSY